jgi:phage terminase small subunit
MKPKLKPLKARERMFVEALPLTDPPYNGTQAARKAGYGKTDESAAVLAVRLLRKVNVAAEIEAMKTATSKRHEITKDRLIREVARAAFVDPGAYFDTHGNPIEICELPEGARRALNGFEFYEDFEGKGESRKAVGYTKKIKWHDKTTAQRLLAQLLGFLVEKKEISGAFTLEQLVDALEKTDEKHE